MADILASVSVVLGAEISGFRAAMADARKELRGLVQFSEGLKDVGTSLTQYVSAPIALLGAASLKVGGDFQSAFNRVQAATQASGSELEALRKKAQGIALDPNLQFSSVQAAQALENLAKNGASTADILGGAVDATTALATATGAQLATAADITTDVMNNFGKSAEQAAGLVSNITGATVASKFSIDDYRQALGQAGAVAGQLGASFEDFNTALSLTSSGFSSGSDAGTSFKTFLQRLVPQSKEAEEAMHKLGLNFFDTQGKLLPLRDVAGQLQKAFAGLSDQAKNTFGTQIFGADSIRTALLLAKSGSEGFDEMAASIGKVDAAAQGSVLNQGFTGGLEVFKSSVEGLAQAIADSGLLDFFDGLLRKGASLAAGLAQLNPAVLATGTVLAGLAAAVGPVALALGTLGAALPAIRAGIVEVQGATLLLQNNMGLLRGVLASVLSPTGAIIAALGTLALVIYAARTEGERAYASFQKQSEATRKLDSSLTPLLDRYDALKSKTQLSAKEQQELRDVVERVTAIMPEAGTKIDAYGNFIDIAADKARKSIATFQGLDKAFALSSLPAARAKLKELEEGYASLQRTAVAVNETGKLNGVELTSLGAKGAAENIGYLRDNIAQAGEELDKQRKQVKDFEQAAGLLAGTVGGGLVQALTEADIALKFFGARTEDAAAKAGLLATLQARLKTVQDAKPDLTSKADIAASNQLIDSLQQQIDQLNKLGLASKEMQKAYAEVQKSLRTVANESLALGDQYEYLKSRQSALESGVKRLIGAGFSPASSAVRSLVADLRSLNSTFLNASESLDLRKLKGADKLFETPEFKVPELPKMELPQAVLPNYEAIFSNAAQGILTGTGGIEQAFGTFTQAQADFNTNVEALLDAFPKEAFGNIASAIGGALGSGTDVVEAAGKALLGSLAKLGAQFGQYLIALGVANLTVPGAQPLGIAQIAGGGALVVAAGVLGAFAGSGGGAGSTGSAVSTSPASNPRAFTPSVAPSATAKAEPTTIIHQVQITANGRDLQGTLLLETDRLGRVKGFK